MATVSRIECPKCSASCIDGETNCWQCGALLKPPTPKPALNTVPIVPPKRSKTLRFPVPGKPAPKDHSPAQVQDLIRFDDEHTASLPSEPPKPTQPLTQDGTIPLPPLVPEKQTRVLLTGEVFEEDAPQIGTSSSATVPLAARIGDLEVIEADKEEVMTLTFCRNCGFENEPGKKECAKCGKQLEIIAVKDYKEMQGLSRAWGFDLLGAVWIILGLAAIFAGQFILQTDPDKLQPSNSDYLWTGAVAIAPGVLVIMRHYVCRTVFWVMVLASIMVWTVLFIVWITGHLQVGDKDQIGLTWLFSLSLLSAISFFFVRTNDAFDYDIGAWLGRQ